MNFTYKKLCEFSLDKPTSKGETGFVVGYWTGQIAALNYSCDFSVPASTELKSFLKSRFDEILSILREKGVAGEIKSLSFLGEK